MGFIRKRIQPPAVRPKAVEGLEVPVVPDREITNIRPFRLIGVEIVGSTVYSPARPGDFHEPYLGREIAPAEVEDIRATMASAGGGVRFSLPRDVAAGIEVTKPLIRSASPGEDSGYGPRIFFSLNARF